MDESTLLAKLKTLELSWGSLDSWLRFWIAIVVIGVAMEVVVIVIEYRHERHAFNRGIIRPPDKPSIRLFGCGLLGASLVAIGVAGEFCIHIKAGVVEAKMREANRSLVALVNARASNAIERASTNEQEAAGLRVKAAKLGKEAEDERLARVKIERQFANRHIPAKKRDTLIKKLRAFSGEKAVIDIFPVTFEHVVIASDIEGILLNAGWNAPPPNRLSAPAEIMVQGVWVQATADDRSQRAATEVFNLLSPHTSGVRSPVPLPKPEDPRVWILVGDTPTPLREWVK